ncbi:MAG TPA: rhamnulokinase family protein [Pyrinomonadaceae bacterium]|nr:rhamnulokinase family protein [Pyrinomonadaceae bacterium]
MSDHLYIAVDLGAGSGRVFLAGLDESELLLQQIRRFQYPPSISGGHLRWDVPKIFAEIKEGLREAAVRARQLGREIRSIGVDSWGVDYGLIDGDGHLVELPVCYRDDRTRGVMEEVFERVPRAEIFRRTGTQFLKFNTLFQLCAHTREGIPANAHQLLLIPDLINFFLTGRIVAEYTNASTTQMLNAQTGNWDVELLDCLSLPKNLLPEIVSSGTDVGLLRAELADELGIGAVWIIAPATHDTGSAVMGAPLETGWAYISSGTWSLVGVERDDVLINDDVARHNFTNEGGAFGTIRFLKNVMGLWILEVCRKEWQQRSVAGDLDELLRDVAAIGDYDALIFPDDERFLNPPSMLEAIATQLNETDQMMPSRPAAITKVILDSLAFRYASVFRTIESLTNQRIKGVRIIGGGSQNAYLNQATANATGLPVRAGPVEATVIGNVIVQAVSSGRFSSLADAREYVGQKIESQTFMPKDSTACGGAMRRYAEIEAQYN